MDTSAKSAWQSLLLDIPFCQVVLTIAKTLRIFFKPSGRLLVGSAGRPSGPLKPYLEALVGEEFALGVIVS